MIIVAGILAGIFVLLQLILVPIFDWRSEQQKAVGRAESLLEIVAEAAATRGAPSTGDADGDTPIRNALSETATAGGVNLIYVNVRPDGGVDASVSNADPAALFDWLSVLDSNYAIRPAVADISREQGDPGLVRAQLTFRRGA